MTDKEAFLRAREHLLRQGELSWDGTSCEYRHLKSDGTVLMCAVGCLIPDGEYRVSMEDKGVSMLLQVAPASSLSSLRGLSLGMLSHLQSVHDTRQPSEWGALLDPSLWLFAADGRFVGVLPC